MKQSYDVTVLFSNEYTMTIQANNAKQAEMIAKEIVETNPPPHGYCKTIDIVKIEPVEPNY